MKGGAGISTRFWRRTAFALALGLVLVRSARAASSATLNIDVTLSGAVSVSVEGAATSTTTVNFTTPDQLLVNAATATVRNDSGIFTEKWALSSNANTINAAGGAGTWTIQASTNSPMGPDQAAVQVVFGSSNTASCPIAGSNDWNQAFAAPLTTALQTYGNGGLFADANLNVNGTPSPDSGQRLYAGSQRALCWRVLAPSTTSTQQTQNVQIIVTAQ